MSVMLLSSRFRQVLIPGLLAACSFAAAQTGPKQTPGPTDSVLDFYAGYGYLHPFPPGIDGHDFQAVSNINATGSMQYYFHKNFGAELAGEWFSGPSPRGSFGQCDPGCADRDASYVTAEAGPAFRFSNRLGLVPFVHVMGGGARIRGPYLQSFAYGYGLTGGGGVDYILPILHNHFAIRGEANYQYLHANYGPVILTGEGPSHAGLSALKASGGVVLRLGSQAPPVPVSLSCSAQPATVFPGDPVMVTGSALNLSAKRTPVYTWTATGGQVMPSGATATVATRGLAPGSYTVSGTVSEGPKTYQQAACTAVFAVKAYEPPTLSCSANPSSLMAGDTATITSTGMSPQNRSLTYSYTASAGQVSGTGATATLGTAGVAPGTITVNCTVTDDMQQTATAQTSVVVEAAAAPPAKAEAQKLCSISFSRDTRRPMRVDNEAKACLDDIALTLQRTTDSKLEVIGNQAADESADRAAVRALNERSYLTKERGIDASRIELRTGTGGERSVDNMLLPAGATMPDGTTMVDPSTIKPEGQAYGTPGAHAAKHGHRHHKHKAS